LIFRISLFLSLLLERKAIKRAQDLKSLEKTINNTWTGPSHVEDLDSSQSLLENPTESGINNIKTYILFKEFLAVDLIIRGQHTRRSRGVVGRPD